MCWIYVYEKVYFHIKLKLDEQKKKRNFETKKKSQNLIGFEFIYKSKFLNEECTDAYNLIEKFTNWWMNDVSMEYTKSLWSFVNQQILLSMTTSIFIEFH